jgi:hypothetical protein
VAIAHQPAMTAEPTSTRPVLPRSPHEPVLVRQPPRTWTVFKISGLLALTALGVALGTAMVAGAALFTILNFR